MLKISTAYTKLCITCFYTIHPPMKKETSEGGLVREYLRKKKINQGDLANKIGMTRQGLVWHLGQKKLGHEFKMKLRDNGVPVFDETGKESLSEETTPTMQIVPKTVEELLELHRKHEATQEKLITQQDRELNTAYKYISDLEEKLGIK